MKKLFCLLLAAVMLCGMLTSCGGAGAANYIVLEEDFGSEYYGIGFRKDDNTLTLKVQSILDEMIADGTYAKISTDWFGKDTSVKDVQFPREITDTGDGSLQYIMDKGELILGLDSGFPPMGFVDSKGEIVGFDIDLAKEVCERLGVKLKLQTIDWAAKELELNSKNIDCIWNGMTITDERAANMNITKPYIANRQSICVSEASGIATIADLAGKKVGTQNGSAGQDAVEAKPEIKDTFGEFLPTYKTFDDAYLDLKKGVLDAIVIDEIAIRYMMETDKG